MTDKTEPKPPKTPEEKVARHVAACKKLEEVVDEFVAIGAPICLATISSDNQNMIVHNGDSIQVLGLVEFLRETARRRLHSGLSEEENAERFAAMKRHLGGGQTATNPSKVN